MPKMSIKCQPEGEYLLARPLGQLLELVVDRLELADEVPGEPTAGCVRASQTPHGREQVECLSSGGRTSRLAWMPSAGKSAGGQSGGRNAGG
jgi:hypothetical protein